MAVNHANRNASNPMSNKQIATAYTAAVLTSCSLSVGLNHLVSKADSFNPIVKGAVQRVVPYVAVASAGALNVLLMRKNEMDHGIAVTDETGKVMGTSKVAGQMAITQVVLSRVFLPAPIMILPPVIMSGLEKVKMVTKATRFPLQVAVITACLWGALPCAIGLFPQISEVDPKKLEPQFHGLVDEKGRPITKLFFNKGL